MIDLDRLAALCDAAIKSTEIRARVDANYPGLHLGNDPATEVLRAALDPATVRQLIDAYKCLLKMADALDDVALPDTGEAWAEFVDAWNAARKIVKGE